MHQGCFSIIGISQACVGAHPKKACDALSASPGAGYAVCMLRRSLELVSPVPPMRTGTANYLDMLVSRVAPVARVHDDVVVVSDPGGVQGASLPETLYGVPVVSADDRPPDPPVGVTRIVFLANNPYHIFAHEMLRRQTSRAAGRTIVVLHDPSMFMVHRHMANGVVDGFGVEQLIESVQTQLGGAAERQVIRRLNEMLPDVFDHGVHCMGNSLRVADEVWVHSVYAANRILYENDIEMKRLPRIRVCAHPNPESEEGSASPDAHAGRPAGATFRIGLFGWVTPPKRVISVLQGLALAIDRLPVEERSKLELMIVGRKPPESSYDPAAEASRLALNEHVQFIDYPDASTFENLIGTCDLIFNLRYPSCGESSGTLASAESISARYVVSRFQSFREAQGAWRYINVAQPYEVWDIAEAVLDAFYGGDDQRAGVTRSAIAPVEKLVLSEILKQRVG